MDSTKEAQLAEALLRALSSMNQRQTDSQRDVSNEESTSHQTNDQHPPEQNIDSEDSTTTSGLPIPPKGKGRGWTGRDRGRPPGSKNKPKQPKPDPNEPKVPKKRGRPPGSKNKKPRGGHGVDPTLGTSSPAVPPPARERVQLTPAPPNGYAPASESSNRLGNNAYGSRSGYAPLSGSSNRPANDAYAPSDEYTPISDSLRSNAYTTPNGYASASESSDGLGNNEDPAATRRRVSANSSASRSTNPEDFMTPMHRPYQPPSYPSTPPGYANTGSQPNYTLGHQYQRAPEPNPPFGNNDSTFNSGYPAVTSYLVSPEGESVYWHPDHGVVRGNGPPPDNWALRTPQYGHANQIPERAAPRANNIPASLNNDYADPPAWRTRSIEDLVRAPVVPRRRPSAAYRNRVPTLTRGNAYAQANHLLPTPPDSQADDTSSRRTSLYVDTPAQQQRPYLPIDPSLLGPAARIAPPLPATPTSMDEGPRTGARNTSPPPPPPVDVTLSDEVVAVLATMSADEIEKLVRDCASSSEADRMDTSDS